MSVYNGTILIRCLYYKPGHRLHDYKEVGYAAYGWIGFVIATALHYLYLFGCPALYLVLAASNLHSLLEHTVSLVIITQQQKITFLFFFFFPEWSTQSCKMDNHLWCCLVNTLPCYQNTKRSYFTRCYRCHLYSYGCFRCVDPGPYGPPCSSRKSCDY